MPITRFPKVDTVCADLIGLPYQSSLDCWNFVHFVISKSFPHIILPKDIFAASDFLIEIWSMFDNLEYMQLIQPWDIVLFSTNSAFVDHCGLVINVEKFINTKESTGVCIEYLSNYRDKMFQIVRLQHLY